MERNSKTRLKVGLLGKNLLRKSLLEKSFSSKLHPILRYQSVAGFNIKPNLVLAFSLGASLGVSSLALVAKAQGLSVRDSHFSSPNWDNALRKGHTLPKNVIVPEFFSLDGRGSQEPYGSHSTSGNLQENQADQASIGDESSQDPFGIVGGSTVEDLSDPVFKHTVRILGSGVVSGSAPGIGGRTLNWRCSGTYLTAETVLTAAHCAPEVFTYEFENKTYQAGFASRKFEIFSAPKAGSGEYSGVKAVAVERNPSFVDLWYSKNSNPWNPSEVVADIAIIKLEYSLSRQKEKIPAIAINLPQKGESLILAGYGKYNPSAELELPQLRKAVSPYNLVLRNQSDFVVGSGDFLKPSSQKNPKGACYGDSGGPVYQEVSPGKLALIGVISRGPDAQNGGCASSLSIATHVSSFRSWLDAALKRMNQNF